MKLDNDAVRAALPESVLTQLHDGGNEQLIVDALLWRVAEADRADRMIAVITDALLNGHDSPEELDQLRRDLHHYQREIKRPPRVR